MKPTTFGIFVIVALCLVLATAFATAGPSLEAREQPSLNALPPPIGAATSTPYMGKVTYFINDGYGVDKYTLDASNTVTIGTDELLVFQVPVEVSGPAGQKGMVDLVLSPSAQVTHSKLLKPGKQATFTTNPPLEWFSTGPRTLYLEVMAPDGGYKKRTVTVNVVA